MKFACAAAPACLRILSSRLFVPPVGVVRRIGSHVERDPRPNLCANRSDAQQSGAQEIVKHKAKRLVFIALCLCLCNVSTGSTSLRLSLSFCLPRHANTRFAQSIAELVALRSHHHLYSVRQHSSLPGQPQPKPVQCADLMQRQQRMLQPACTGRTVPACPTAAGSAL